MNLKQATNMSLTGLTVALVAAVVVGMTYVGIHAARHSSGPRLYLNPAKSTLTVGQTLSVDVHEDSLTTGVNAVQVNLTYPSNLLSFTTADATNSGFSIAAQSTDTGTRISIARGSLTALTGDQLVARVNFTVKTQGTAAINIASGSALVGATTNQDILASMSGGSYHLR